MALALAPPAPDAEVGAQPADNPVSQARRAVLDLVVPQVALDLVVPQVALDLVVPQVALDLVGRADLGSDGLEARDSIVVQHGSRRTSQCRLVYPIC